MYLSPKEIDGLFADLRSLGPPGMRFVFTFMELDQRGRPAFRDTTWLVRLWLRLMGEPFKWGLALDGIGRFVEERGFVLKDVTTGKALREKYLSDLPNEVSAHGEVSCVADRRI